MNDKYYYSKMINGYMIECFEIAYNASTPYAKTFCYTPDDMHYNSITVWNGDKSIDLDNVHLSVIPDGYTINYNGNKIEYIDSEHIGINNRIIPVDVDYTYVYKLLKTKIKASGGCKGLIQLIDNAITNNFGTCRVDTIINAYRG